MSGKDCHIQSHPLTADHIRWSKGCRWDVGKRLSHLVTSINWRISEMEQGLRAACGVCVTGKNSIHKIETNTSCSHQKKEDSSLKEVSWSRIVTLQ